ncbi:MAG: hypothetical protein QM763_25400 [Agriterribacter sp.]
MKTIYYILIVVSLALLSQSCFNGYKLTAKQDPHSSSYEFDNKKRTGKTFSLIRTDEFTRSHVEGFMRLGEIEYFQADGYRHNIDGVIEIKNSDSAIPVMPILSYNDVLFEFTITEMSKIPFGDYRIWLGTLPPWIPGMILAPINIRKKDPYIIAKLKVYSADGNLVSSYTNFQSYKYKMKAQAYNKRSKDEVRPTSPVVLKKGFGLLSKKLMKQFEEDSIAQINLAATQKLLVFKSILEINNSLHSKYYMPLLAALENGSKKTYDNIKSRIIKEFKYRNPDEAQRYMWKAFNRYAELKYIRLLETEGKEQADLNYQADIKKFEHDEDVYQNRTKRIIENRRQWSLIASTVASAINTTNLVTSLQGQSNPQVTTDIFMQALKANIAANYPQLTPYANTPSLFTPAAIGVQQPISQSGILANGGDCSAAEKDKCAAAANNDPEVKKWLSKVENDPKMYNIENANIALQKAFLKHCGNCLTSSERTSMVESIQQSEKRLSDMSSDKYISADRPPGYTQSIYPPGYGYKPPDGNDTYKKKGTIKASKGN